MCYRHLLNLVCFDEGVFALRLHEIDAVGIFIAIGLGLNFSKAFLAGIIRNVSATIGLQNAGNLAEVIIRRLSSQVREEAVRNERVVRGVLQSDLIGACGVIRTFYCWTDVPKTGMRIQRVRVSVAQSTPSFHVSKPVYCPPLASSRTVAIN
jgi:hypothetical protein